ncbi:MAG: heparinase II/III family protein [Daejeonella sp.]
MDSELRNFKRKVTTIPKVKALAWIFVFVFKLSLHFAKKKLFKKSKVEFNNPAESAIYQNSIIQNLGFLTNAEYLNDTHFNIQQSFNTPPNWKHLFNDEQDLHLLHRMRDLPFASWRENNFDFFYILIEDWVSKNPVGSLPGWHPYTLSERLTSLCFTLNFISDKADKKVEQLFKTTIAEQASFLRNNFEFWLGHHNHLINNARALLIASVLLPELPQAPEWRKFAIKIFKQEWPYQIFTDGVHAEQSVTYHFLLTRTLWEMKYLMEQVNEHFPFGDDLSRMIEYAQIIARPDGTIPFLGHLTPDWHWTELVGLLPVWGYDCVSVSNLGKLYRSHTNGNLKANNQKGVFLFLDAGQGVLRTEKIHAVLSCDTRGEVAIHGDQNLLGLDIWYAGTHLIRDTGLASYNLDAKREWYSSWRGQSTFCIDDFEPSVSNWRKKQLPKSYYSVKSILKGNKENMEISTSHTGYSRLVDPVEVERRVEVKSEDELLIRDFFRCQQQHTYIAHFHFGNHAVERVSEKCIRIRDLANGNNFLVCWISDLAFRLEENPYAIAYGDEKTGTTGVFKISFVGNTKVEYVIKCLQ